MKFDIHNKPVYAMVDIELAPGESITCESGCMVAMSPELQIDTSMGGVKSGCIGRVVGFFIALVRKVLGGESMFLNTYTAKEKAGKLMIAPAMVGDIQHRKLGGKGVYLEGSAYLASVGDVTLTTKWMGCKSIFSGEGSFLLHAAGNGEVWFNCYGALTEIDVNGSYIVDTGHLVAFDEALQWTVKTVGGLKSTMLSGEGLVLEFTGQGKLWIQSRNINTLVGWLTPLLPG